MKLLTVLHASQRLLAILLAAVVTALFVMLSAPKAAADRFNTETSASARGLTMGNAVINTERGPYSVFYNPANLSARGTPISVQPVNIQMDYTELQGSITKNCRASWIKN